MTNKKLVCVGAVPHYPDEDAKLRATALAVRRGGNCPNTLEVLQQLLRLRGRAATATAAAATATAPVTGTVVTPYLISCLPARGAAATAQIVESFGPDALVDLSECVYRAGSEQPASSYIIRSAATGSRTLVNYNDLPEMTAAEFVAAADRLSGDDDYQNTWFHFEGRIPETTLQCIRWLRRSDAGVRVSVEIEKPGREGLEDLAAEADVVFYSRSWAESRQYESAAQCLDAQSGVARRATVGAGDTFVAGILFGLLCHEHDWDVEAKLRFAVQLATAKVQQEGFDGVGAARLRAYRRR
ncbi:Ribokinase-like protein [Xylariaceae sp. FL0804]|nr:Ribokinase-like protein [Xylariaceae sp. FL0804]